MPVLKTNNSGFARDAIVLDLGDIGRQAAKLRAAAEAKAAQIAADAEREAQRLIEGAQTQGHEQGHAAGYQQGLEEGREQGRQEAFTQAAEELGQIGAAWTEAIGQIDAGRHELDRQARQAVLELALKLAAKVVHRVVEVDPAVVADQVGAALAHVLRPLDVSVRIHPDDRPALDAAMPDLMTEFRHLQHIGLVDDPAITRGGCIVTYGQGEIDATLDMQLARLTELMVPGEAVNDPPSAAGDTQAPITGDGNTHPSPDERT